MIIQTLWIGGALKELCWGQPKNCFIFMFDELKTLSKR